MTITKCSLITIVMALTSGMFGWTDAFLTAPLPAYARGLATFDPTQTNKKSEFNEVLGQIHEENGILENINGRPVDERSSIYVIAEFESEVNEDDASSNSTTGGSTTATHNPLDPWSIVWYIGSFGGLVAFFLVVSCSEWCCRRGARPLGRPYSQAGEVVRAPPGVQETPPPPYHLFAPPPYDSIYYGDITDKTSGEEVDIYVIAVPVHDASREQTT